MSCARRDNSILNGDEGFLEGGRGGGGVIEKAP